MSKKMLINASHPEENRVAIVVDGILSELDIEIAGQQQTKGNIYKAVVVRVEPGLQAAFVDYGAEKHGFLQTGEIHPNLHPARSADSKDYPRINDILHRGQEILVQVVKGERGTKGAALTTFLSLPGRYMVLMPDSSTKGVSRKIEDDKERKALKKTMAQLDLPDEMGYIVRTAGIGKEESELKRDFNYLVSLYKGILARKERVKAPAQLYQESDIVIRSIRDYFSTEMDEVLIDDSQVYQQARDFFSLVMPAQLHLVKQHREKRPIFSRYQIEEQIESLARNQVPLPSGGSIVIDQTEALVAIDVNSGRMAGEKGIEATAARSNIEAAAEIGRQLRLRDLGGLIVIDFIDMRDRKKVREVEQTLKESVEDDKARITLGKISQFGLLELSRQRIRPTLSVGAYLDCPHCHGMGRIKSPEAQAVALLRQLHATVSKGQIGTIKAIVPLDVANYLHNEKRQALTELENRFDLRIKILASLDALPEQVELELFKREKVQLEDSAQAPVSHSEGIEKALAAANAPAIETVEAAKMDAAETAADDAQASDDTEAPTAEGTPESTTAKRRRRRRRKRRSGAGESAQNDQTQGDESQDESEAAIGSEQPAESGVEPIPAAEAVSDTKPKRRGRRPSARKIDSDKASTPAEAATSDEILIPLEAQPQVEETATPAAAENTSVAEKPKRRSRKAAPKKVAEPAAVVPVPVPLELEQIATPPADDLSAAPPAETPKRRTRKPAAQKAEEKKAETGLAVKPAEIAAAAAGDDTPKRPNRRAAAKKTTAPVATRDTPTPVEKKATESGQPSATVKVDEPALASLDTAPSASVAKPKRRARRPAAKKTEEPAAETAVEAPAVIAEKPKQRTRKPAAKKVVE